MLRIFLFFLAVIPTFLSAQNISTVDRYYPPPPNAASMAKYGEVPVENFSGTANISIPIYTVQEGELSVPVSLNYHTGGIKVTEVASWAGLGWALNAGGSITRQVNGSIDEGGHRRVGDGSDLSHGWYEYGNYYSDELAEVTETIDEILINSNCQGNVDPEDTQYKYLLSKWIGNGNYDTQPDLFYLNLPGYSGKFYFNDQHQAILDPFQNVVVEPMHDPNLNPNNGEYSRFTYFKVTTPDGVKYFFGGTPDEEQNTNTLDRSYSNKISGDPLVTDQVVNTWHLRKIESVNGDFTIIFNYEKQTFLDFTYNGSVYYNTSAFNLDEGNLSVTVTEEARLSSINGTHTQINFTENEDPRDDLVIPGDVYDNYFTTSGFDDFGPPKLLDQIDVLVNGGCEATYHLDFENFPESTINTPFFNYLYPNVFYQKDKAHYAKKRPKLAGLRQMSCTSQEELKHEFDYHDSKSILPSRLSFEQDHWGYYKDVIFNYKFFPKLDNSVRESVVQEHDYYLAGFNNGLATNRSADEEDSGAFLLKSVIYPTGAQTIIETEGNRVRKRSFELISSLPYGGHLNSNCTYPGPGCCTSGDVISLNNVVVPGSTESPDGSSITHYSLQAGIDLIDACNPNGLEKFHAFFVAKKIDGNTEKAVYTKLMEIDPSIPGDNAILDFNIALDEKVKDGANPACWWNTNESYNVYLYKGSSENDPLGSGTGLKLTLQIKENTSSITHYNDYEVGGRRISRIIEKDGDNTYSTQYKYVDENDNESGILFDYPKYLIPTLFNHRINCNLSPPYEDSTNEPGGTGCNHKDYKIVSNPIFALTSTLGNGMGYKTVQVIREGGENVGKKVFNYETNCVGNEENFYPKSWISESLNTKKFPVVSKLIGKLKSEVYYSDSNTPVFESFYKYSEKNFIDESDRFTAHTVFRAVSNCNPLGTVKLPEVLPSSYVQLIEKREILDGLETMTQYAYRNDQEHINPVSINVSRNGFSLMSTANYYAQDVIEQISQSPSSEPHLTIGNMEEMINRKMVNVLVKSETSGLKTSGVKNVLTIQQGRLLLTEQYGKDRDEWVLQSSLSYTNDDPFPDVMSSKLYEDDFELEWYIPYSIDNGGQLKTQTYNEHESSFIYNANRRLQSRTEIDNQSTNYLYDGFNRLQTTTIYGANNGLKSTINNQYSIDFSGNDNFITNTIDFPDGKSLETMNTYRPSGLLQATIRIGYGPQQQDVLTAAYVYDEFKRMSSVDDYQTGQTRFAYYPDPLDRVKVETYSDASEKSFQYGSAQIYNTVEVTDENENKSKGFTDLLGRTVRSDGYITDTEIASTHYSYFPFGAIQGVLTPELAEYAYTYDNFGRLETKTVPRQGSIEYTYDDYYRLESMTDANQREHIYHYDNYNRNTLTYLDGTLINQNYYDKGNTAGIYRGKLWKTDEKTVDGNVFGDVLSSKFSFDEFGRVGIEDTDNHIGGKDLINYGYDFADNMLSANKNHTGYATDLNVNSTFIYDHSFRLKNEFIQVGTDPGIQLKQNFYNVSDQLIQVNMRGKLNDVLQRIDYQYNSRSWLTHINEVGDNGIPLPYCSRRGRIPCEDCERTYTATSNVGSSNDFVIVDLYGGGDRLVPLDYPYRSDELNDLKQDLEQWLTLNGYHYSNINVSVSAAVLEVLIEGSNFEFNRLNISDATSNKTETLFTIPNAEDYIENNNEYCNLCQQFGYDCETCPVWEILENCPNCPPMDPQVLTSLDCPNCDIGGYGVLPQKLNVKLNPASFAASHDQLIHWDVSAILYLQDSSAIGFQPSGTYLSGNPSNAILDTNDVYITVDLPALLLARDNQNVVQTVLNETLSEALEQVFVDMQIIDATVADRLDIMVAEITAEMITIMAPFAKEDYGNINPTVLTNEPGIQYPDIDAFKMRLFYQEGDPVFNAPAQYNGNISGMIWQSGNERKRSYGLRYDGLDRLSIASYADWTINNDWHKNNNLAASYTYDKDGNFNTLRRNGPLLPCSPRDPSIYGYGQIDNMSYKYQDDQLLEVIDQSAPYRGFKNGSSTYAYDGMGSITADGGKGLNVANNFLNLPASMLFGDGSLNIKYTSGGKKIQKKSTSDDNGIEIIDYCNGIEYKDGEIAAIHHSCGRVIPNEGKPGAPYRYQFYLTDHLGNVRVLFEDKDQNGTLINPKINNSTLKDDEVIEISHYYPFGMEMGVPDDSAWDGGANGRENGYLYNGKELNEDFGLDWLDYGARWYDPAIGRWGQVDPLAEKYYPISPYAYVANNPLRYIDPDGRQIEPIYKKGGGKDGRDLLTIKVTGKLINFSDNNVSMETALKDITALIEKSYQGENIDGVDIKVDFNFSIAESMDDVEESDHLIVLAEAKNSKIPGVSNGFGGKVTAVDADYFNGPYDVFIGEEGERTTAHEVGHLFGLTHESGEGKRSNLMTQGRAEMKGNKITKRQLGAVRNNLKNGRLNKGYNYTNLGLPNLGIGFQVMNLRNIKGRRKKLK